MGSTPVPGLLMSFHVPIVLFIYNRPQLTRAVVEAIADLAPQTVYIIGDGPRPGEEPVRVEAARREALRLREGVPKTVVDFAPSNLGLRKRVTSGLNRIFSEVENAIILEDDCFPHPDFFTFCRDLLEHYRENPRVGVISGTSYQDGRRRGRASYYFSRYAHCWGWATWRRAWAQNDPDLSDWPDRKATGWLESFLPDPRERHYWTGIFDGLYERDEPDSWAYRWTYSCWKAGALTAIPQVNLVSNRGFGSQATHTRDAHHSLASMPTGPLRVTRHPPDVCPHAAADRYTWLYGYGGVQHESLGRWRYRLNHHYRKWRARCGSFI